MRIVSLVPFLTETLCALGLSEQLVGVSHRCDHPEATVQPLPKLTAAWKVHPKSEAPTLAEALCPDQVDMVALRGLAPDVVVTRDMLEGSKVTLPQLQESLRKELGSQVRLLSYNPRTYQQILEMFQHLGEKVERVGQGHELSSRMQAQVKDWASNFYERTRGKKVTFLNGTDPLVLGGLWIPDLIHLTSAVSQFRIPGEKHRRVSWDEVRQFAPDTIVIAPSGLTLDATIKKLPLFEALPGWEEVPAVKRGEVVFTDGKAYFNRPGPRIMDSMGVLVSAVAGLESGYITPRDSFFRLRWVELQRHRF